MDPLGLQSAAGEHQFAVEVPALEHGLKGFGELRHVIEMFIVLETNAVLGLQVADELVLPDVHIQELLKEIKVRGLEVRQEVFGGVLDIVGFLALSRLLLLGLGLSCRVLSFRKAVFPGDLLSLPQITIFER